MREPGITNEGTNMKWLIYMKWLIFLIFLLSSIGTVNAEVLVTNYSNEYITDDFLFGAKYYSIVHYTLLNNGSYPEKIKLGFLNSKNDILDTESFVISSHSSYSGITYVRTGTFFYIRWGNKEEVIYPKILTSMYSYS